jgi:hypothetical protein
MSEITDALSLSLEQLQRDATTGQRLQATSNFIAQLEFLCDGDIDPLQVDTLQEQWKGTTQATLKAKNTALVKFGKALAPIDDFSLSDSYLYKIDKSDTNLTIINNLIKLHLIRNGNVGIFSHEIDFSLLEKFNEMNTIEKHTLQGELEPAIVWCQENLPLQSSLLFQLHELRFHQLLANDTVEAYKYAKSTFRQFITPETLQTVSKLMSSLLVPITDQSIKPVVSSKDLHQLSKLFTQAFSSRLGFPATSTLDTILLASHLSLPTLLKFTLLQRQRNLWWSTTNELPFEVKLPSLLKFHAVFICPVSKEETGAKGNEAYGLPCGHVISKGSLIRLSGKNGSVNRSYVSPGRFKCPYCPSIAAFGDCREVRFYRL